MIVLKVGDKRFSEWTSVNVELGLNTVSSTFSFEGWMTEETKEIFKPFTCLECEVIITKKDGTEETLLTGFCMNSGISTQKVPRLSMISGFSKTGILEQCTFPKAMAPFQWENISLWTLSQMICNHFNLNLVVHPGAMTDAAKKFENIECQSTETIKSVLSKYGEARGITVSHENTGSLFLYKIVNITESSSFLLEEDYDISMVMTPNAQGMFSEVSVMSDSVINVESEGSSKSDDELGFVTSYSPFLPYINITKGGVTKQIKLPKNYVITDADQSDLKKLANKKVCEQARNFEITIEKEGWDFDGRIVRAGFYLNIDAPDLFIDGNLKVVVESMKFTKDSKGPEMLTFSCVIPQVYTGVIPKNPFVK